MSPRERDARLSSERFARGKRNARAWCEVGSRCCWCSGGMSCKTHPGPWGDGVQGTPEPSHRAESPQRGSGSTSHLFYQEIEGGRVEPVVAINANCLTCRKRSQRIAFVPWGHGRPRMLGCVGSWRFLALPQAWLGQGRSSCVHPFTQFINAPVSQSLRLNTWKAGMNSGTTSPSLCFIGKSLFGGSMRPFFPQNHPWLPGSAHPLAFYQWPRVGKRRRGPALSR